jgi:hypothetical protein
MLRLIMPFALGLLVGLGGTSALAVTRAKDAARHAVPVKPASDSTHADSTQAGEHAAVAAATPAPDTTHAAAPADSAHGAPTPAPPTRTPVKAATPKRPPAPAVAEAHTGGHDALDTRAGTGTAPEAKARMRTDPKAGAAPRLPGLEVVERLAAASTADAKVPAERRLAKYFGAMPAKDAAKILEQMDDRDVQTILSFVGDRQAAAILGSLSPQRAASIGRASLRPQPKGR